MRLFATLVVLFTVSSLAGARAELPTPVPSGIYKLDPRHTSITFAINHLGFSYFTGRFDKVSGDLDYNAKQPENSHLQVTVDVASIDTNDAELDESLRSDSWFDVASNPTASFNVTKIEMSGAQDGKITGDFTLHNITHELTLTAHLVGSGELPIGTGHDIFSDTHVIGITANGSFDRSTYGIDNLGSLVGDQVSLQIESEFEKE